MDIQPRWLYIVAIVGLTLIFLDEFTYRAWKVGNPGSMFPSAYRNVSPPIEPPNWKEY